MQPLAPVKRSSSCPLLSPFCQHLCLPSHSCQPLCPLQIMPMLSISIHLHHLLPRSLLQVIPATSAWSSCLTPTHKQGICRSSHRHPTLTAIHLPCTRSHSDFFMLVFCQRRTCFMLHSLLTILSPTHRVKLGCAKHLLPCRPSCLLPPVFH